MSTHTIPRPRKRMKAKHADARFDVEPCVRLDAVELAALLVPVAVAGVRVIDRPREVEGLVRSLWSDLHRADRDVAHATFTRVVEAGAPVAVVLDIAELLHTFNQIRPERKLNP